MGPSAGRFLEFKPALRHDAKIGVRRFDDGSIGRDPGDVMVGFHQNIAIHQSFRLTPRAEIVNLRTRHRLVGRAPLRDFKLDDLTGRLPQTVADKPNTIEMANALARLPPHQFAADIAAACWPVDPAWSELPIVIDPGCGMLVFEGSQVIIEVPVRG